MRISRTTDVARHQRLLVVEVEELVVPTMTRTMIVARGVKRHHVEGRVQDAGHRPPVDHVGVAGNGALGPGRGEPGRLTERGYHRPQYIGTNIMGRP